MMNNFICMIFSIGLISIYSTAMAVSPTVQSIPDSGSNGVDPQPTSPLNQLSPFPQTDHSSQPGPPSLTCILFQNFGCNIQCSLMENLHRMKTVGTCIPDNFCFCTVDMTLEDIWPLKFESTGLLKEIKSKGNENLAKDVLEALQNPYRTAEESVQHLQLILSPEQLKKLSVKRFKETAKPNTDSAYLRNYVDREWNRMVENASELQSINYEEKLLEYLEKNKSTRNQDIREVFNQILPTENGALKEILAKFLAQHKDDDIGEYDFSGEEEKLLQHAKQNPSTSEVLNNIIINKLISEIHAVRIKNQTKPVIPPENDSTESETD